MMTDRDRQVFELLHNPFAAVWSLQGFGMLRTYLKGDAVRLHIWDLARAYDDVSTIHDHPWKFTSDIVSGQLVNQRFVRTVHPPDPLSHRAGALARYNHAVIRPGEGGGIVEPSPEPAWLLALDPEAYTAGDSYSQRAEELHESKPEAGTVTIIKRERVTEADLANVYWRAGDWVTAEPRPATPDEVLHFTSLALSHWAPAVDPWSP